jgi:hypothetical protein
MDELVDELSSALIDVEDNGLNKNIDNYIDIDMNQSHEKSSQMMRSVKNHKPVTRTASILIRSKLLILSDSESDDDHNCGINSKMSQLSARKGKRINKKQNNLNKSLCQNQTNQFRLQMQSHCSPYVGKRKRSSTISEANQSSNTNQSLNGIQMECDNNISDTSSLSESSDDYNSDVNFDGDDEQSDFYEVIAKTNKNNKQRHHNHSHIGRAIDFAVPSARNPFLTMGLSSSSNSSYNSNLSSANMLWKRRRRMH